MEGELSAMSNKQGPGKSSVGGCGECSLNGVFHAAIAYLFSFVAIILKSQITLKKNSVSYISKGRQKLKWLGNVSLN